MKIKKLLVAAFFLSISIGSLASIGKEFGVVSDICLQNCSQQGFGDGYCLRMCSV